MMNTPLKDSLLKQLTQELLQDITNKIVLLYNADESQYKEKVYRSIHTSRVSIAARAAEKLNQALSSDIEKLIVNSSLDSTFIPPNTKRISKFDGITYVVIEQKPQKRLITYSNNLRTQEFLLAFPYVQFHFFHGDNRLLSFLISCTTKTYSSINDPLFRLPLPNMTDGGVCMGDMKMPTGDLTHCTNDLIQLFWSSCFNNSYMDDLLKFAQKMCDSSGKPWITHGNNWQWECFEAWAKQTKENSLFILDQSKFEPISQERKSQYIRQNNIDEIISYKIAANIRKAIETSSQQIVQSDVLKEFNREIPKIDRFDNELSRRLRDTILSLFGDAYREITDQVYKDENSDINKLIEKICKLTEPYQQGKK